MRYIRDFGSFPVDSVVGFGTQVVESIVRVSWAGHNILISPAASAAPVPDLVLESGVSARPADPSAPIGCFAAYGNIGLHAVSIFKHLARALERVNPKVASLARSGLLAEIDAVARSH